MSLVDTAKCVGAIAFAIGSNLLVAGKLIKIKEYIAALGGAREAAQLLLRASTMEERLRVGGQALVALAAELAGLTAVKEACHL